MYNIFICICKYIYIYILTIWLVISTAPVFSTTKPCSTGTGHDCAAKSGRTQRILQHLHGPHMASTGASWWRYSDGMRWPSCCVAIEGTGISHDPRNGALALCSHEACAPVRGRWPHFFLGGGYFTGTHDTVPDMTGYDRTLVIWMDHIDDKTCF